MKLNNILVYFNSIKSLKTNDGHVFIYKKNVSTYIFLETKFTSKMNVDQMGQHYLQYTFLPLDVAESYARDL